MNTPLWGSITYRFDVDDELFEPFHLAALRVLLVLAVGATQVDDLTRVVHTRGGQATKGVVELNCKGVSKTEVRSSCKINIVDIVFFIFSKIQIIDHKFYNKANLSKSYIFDKGIAWAYIIAMQIWKEE